MWKVTSLETTVGGVKILVEWKQAEFMGLKLDRYKWFMSLPGIIENVDLYIDDISLKDEALNKAMIFAGKYSKRDAHTEDTPIEDRKVSFSNKWISMAPNEPPTHFKTYLDGNSKVVLVYWDWDKSTWLMGFYYASPLNIIKYLSSKDLEINEYSKKDEAFNKALQIAYSIF